MRSATKLHRVEVTTPDGIRYVVLRATTGHAFTDALFPIYRVLFEDMVWQLVQAAGPHGTWTSSEHDYPFD